MERTLLCGRMFILSSLVVSLSTSLLLLLGVSFKCSSTDCIADEDSICGIEILNLFRLANVFFCRRRAFKGINHPKTNILTQKTDTEVKKLLNKVIIFVFFVQTIYSRSSIKLRLNHGLF